MVHFLMLIEAIRIPIESVPIERADEAFIPYILVYFVLGVSQLRERVDDYTENDIEQREGDYHEIKHIEHQTHIEFSLLLERNRREELANAASHSESIVKIGEQAVHQSVADGVTLVSGLEQVDIFVVIHIV